MQENLKAFYESTEFKAKEEESATLRAQVKALIPSADTALAAWWNVYDGINVWRSYGVGTPTPSIPDDLFEEVLCSLDPPHSCKPVLSFVCTPKWKHAARTPPLTLHISLYAPPHPHPPTHCRSRPWPTGWRRERCVAHSPATYLGEH